MEVEVEVELDVDVNVDADVDVEEKVEAKVERSEERLPALGGVGRLETVQTGSACRIKLTDRPLAKRFHFLAGSESGLPRWTESDRQVYRYMA